MSLKNRISKVEKNKATKRVDLSDVPTDKLVKASQLLRDPVFKKGALTKVDNELAIIYGSNQLIRV